LAFNPLKEKHRSEYVDSINKFIRQSKSLIHINLSACELQKEAALSIFGSVKKSKTLQSVHFSGNQLTSQIVHKIREILGVRNENKDYEVDRQEETPRPSNSIASQSKQ